MHETLQVIGEKELINRLKNFMPVGQTEDDTALITNSKKVSILTFISYALIKTLTVMKKFNSTADIHNQVLIMKNYINLGIAVDTPHGLVVPSIKNVEKKSVKDINDLIIELSDKARSKKLTPNDLSKVICFIKLSLIK